MTRERVVLFCYQVVLIVCVFIAAWTVFVQKASGHSFYEPWCCNERDCRPIEAKYVHETQEGWDIAPSEGGGFVARGKERQSPDGGYHICRYPAQEIRCFYAPAMGS